MLIIEVYVSYKLSRKFCMDRAQALSEMAKEENRLETKNRVDKGRE